MSYNHPEVELTFFGSDGTPRFESYDQSDDDEVTMAKDDVSSTPYWQGIRRWYVAESDRGYERYDGNNRIYNQAILDTLQGLRLAITHAWETAHPRLPCYWSKTTCSFCVTYEVDNKK
jgi:hypothetical protein